MKLYYEDQYIKEFKAEIIDIKENDGKFHVVLDKTAFFPGGGGQFCDLGTIEKEKVIDVYEENGTIYHVVEKKPIKIHKASCTLDWKRRVDGMQQHLGQHVLSGCFFKLFNANTVGFHMGDEISTVDINGHLNEVQIREAERFANEIIGENIKVDFLMPDKKELKKLNLRRALPKTNEPIRVVKIGDLDINACCGIHPSSTIELRVIKIKRWEKHKSATRIEYVAGNRAVENFFKKDEFSKEVCRYLNCGDESALSTIRNMSSNMKETIDENKKLRLELGDYKIKEMLNNGEKIEDITVVKNIYQDEDVKNLGKLASRIVENNKAVVLFGVEGAGRANLIFTCSKDIKKLNMNEILKDAITLIDGRGGGNKTLAQGAGKNVSNLNSTMDYAMMKVKKLF
ncbi:alanyl-tRNA editing protein [Clostridium cadaveris]|uniref:alanyl-tRNA editing protein n=1 Tax=Clostridium cadaveris TaxID=1529 RepID=UPI00040204EE|nr:DHHA1 domain-containing protein [Clostridium cadaveris]NME63532.1 alanyl-tRNA editing protein AlaX-L [Clostridium cadaveris]NWK09805.1 alanyl-tRNA editing protein AlaX-L [Clostridium cadaveris]